MRSCESRDRPRTRRPKTMSGTTMAGTSSSVSPVSCSEVSSSMTVPPISMTMLRIAIDSEEPTTVWTSVVSAVRRESTSPVRVVSKKAGDSVRTWP
jgi:hypothetical protein